MTIYNGQDATGRLDPEFPGKLMGYLSNNRDLTGLVCYEKNAAGPVIHAASRLGIRVPEDLSVVAFSDGMATDLGINLTTMMVPMWDMAHCAVRMLLRKIQARDQELRGEAVEYTFHPGDTCRALS
jgi:DNA-binding LacI/PurR family transcriptional regulator